MKQLRLTPARVLAVYAHPDDADVAAGGTLASWAAAGADVTLVIGCDGAKGSHDPDVRPDDLRERRAHELAVAAGILGITTVASLDYADGELTNTPELRESLVGFVRRARPDVVLGPDPTASFFGGVYWNHVDHRELGTALLDAVAPASAMPLYFPAAGPAHAVPLVLLSGTHDPDVVVDVTANLETKVKAVLAHASQVGNDAESVRRVLADRASQAGREVAVTYGEAFRSLELAV